MLWPKFLRVVVLPAALLLLAGTGLGCYYETNDDVAITLLLRGITAAAPVTDLHLYFHGLAALLAELYAHFPALPWYGLLLYGLLYAAAVLAFAVLDRLLRGRLTGGMLPGALVVFFGLVWLEHGLWFSYVRVPILLAGSGLLFAAQRSEQRQALLLGLAAISLAALIRPSAALLGLLAAGPGALWLARRRALVLLGAVVVLLGAGQLALGLTRTPAAATYRRLDVLKSGLNDFHLTSSRPRTSADSLGLRAVEQWALGDSTLVNEALFRRAAPFDAPAFVFTQAPSKLAALAILLGRDYFPVLLLLLALAVEVARHPRRYEGRRGFWLGQVGFGLLLLGLGVGLKLPPRLALPVLGLWVLSNLSFVLPGLRRPLRLTPLSLGLLVVVSLLYGYKTAHRRLVLGREQQQNRARLQALRRAAPGPVWVTAGLETTFKSWSPFKEPTLAPHSVLSLTGWTTLDPSQPVFRQFLTGCRTQPAALRYLAARPGTHWLLAPAAVPWLSAYLQSTAGPTRPAVRFGSAPPLPTADYGFPRLYPVRVETVK